MHMVQRKQDELTRRFLFSIMEEVMQEEAQAISKEPTVEERTITEQGHMNASLNLLTKVASESKALDQKPTTGEGWAKNVLERVDALPREAKPVGVRRVARRRESGGIQAKHHGHTEFDAIPANKALKMRTRAVRKKTVMR